MRPIDRRPTTQPFTEAVTIEPIARHVQLQLANAVADAAAKAPELYALLQTPSNR